MKEEEKRENNVEGRGKEGEKTMLKEEEKRQNKVEGRGEEREQC